MLTAELFTIAKNMGATYTPINRAMDKDVVYIYIHWNTT